MITNFNLKLRRHFAILVLACFCVSASGQQDSLGRENVPGIFYKMAEVADWGVDLVTFEKEKYTFFVLPLMGYEERTQLEVGVMPVWRFYLGGKTEGNTYYRPSNISPSIIYSTSGMYEFDFSASLYTKRGWFFRSKWLYQWMPDQFYPIGNTASKNERSEIETKKTELTGKIMKGLNSELFLGVNYDVGMYNIKDVGPGLLDGHIPGFDGGNIIGFGPIASFDNRNNIVYPDAGAFVTLSYTCYPGALGDHSFSTWTFDARKYFKLGDNEQVLATQAYLKSSAGDVPFFRLPVLGGKRLYRGIGHPYKYMDKNSFYVQAAYRSHLWWRLGYEVFTGAGNIAESWGSSTFKNMHLMGGLGLRVRVLEKEKLSFRFDYGMSDNGDSGFFFTLGEAF